MDNVLKGVGLHSVAIGADLGASSRAVRVFALLLSSATLVAACDPVPLPNAERFPPSQPRTATTLGPAPPAPVAPPPAETSTATAAATATAAPPPAPAATATAAPVAAKGELFDADGKILPQTKDEPSTEDPRFKKNVALLWEAIVKNEPDLAKGFFFPVEAYEQVKAIKEPAKDWKYRLYKNFKRDIKQYHGQLGKNRDEAKFLRLDVRRKPEWMKVGREGNLIGYYRVTRSLLFYEDHKGRERQLDLTSMISWRGQWFVVHLHGYE